VFFSAHAEESEKKSSPYALQAGVELNVKLPPLDPSLAPGNRFDLTTVTNLLKKRYDHNDWYKVPDWASGRWHQSKATTVYYRDEVSGVESEKPRTYNLESNFNLGIEKDKGKQVWDFADAYYWTTTESDKTYCHTFVTSLQPVLNNETTCSFRGLSISFVVDKWSNKIVSCKQRENIEIYEYVSRSRMRNKTWHKVFDWSGSPILSATNESTCIKIKQYADHSNEKTSDGRDLHPLFVDYLRNHNLRELIP